MRGYPQNLYLDGENDVLTITDCSLGYADKRMGEFKSNFWILESAGKDKSHPDKFSPLYSTNLEKSIFLIVS